jgi:hypothetical protein
MKVIIGVRIKSTGTIGCYKEHITIWHQVSCAKAANVSSVRIFTIENCNFTVT